MNSAVWAILDGMPKMALKAARRGLLRYRYAGPGMPPVLGEPPTADARRLFVHPVRSPPPSYRE